MASKDELNALADRCEREEPSRELDAEIWWRVEPIRSGICFNNAAMGSPRKLDHDAPIPKGMGRAGVMVSAPAYCSSIDAAVSLVPEGCRTTHIEEILGGWWKCFLRCPDRRLVAGLAKTEPQARAAAIRALAQEQK